MTMQMDISEESSDNAISNEAVANCIKLLMSTHSRRKIFSMDEIMGVLLKSTSGVSYEEVRCILEDDDLFSVKKKGYALYRGSNIKKAVSVNGSSTNKKKKKFSYLWCHQCKQKHEKVYYCSKFATGTCSKKYCKGCIERHYYEKVEDIDIDNWVCLFCRNICTCAFCRRKRGECNQHAKVDRKRAISAPIKYETNNSPEPEDEDDRVIQSHSFNPRFTQSQDNLQKIRKSHSNSSPSLHIVNVFEVELRHLITTGFLSEGDRLSLSFSSRFSGTLLDSGCIRLDWNNRIVNNLNDFLSNASFQNFSNADPWQVIICKGEKLVHYRNAYLLNEGRYNHLSPPPAKRRDATPPISFGQRRRNHQVDAMDIDDGFDSGQFDNDRLSLFYVQKLEFDESIM